MGSVIIAAVDLFLVVFYKVENISTIIFIVCLNCGLNLHVKMTFNVKIVEKKSIRIKVYKSFLTSKFGHLR